MMLYSGLLCLIFLGFSSAKMNFTEKFGPNTVCSNPLPCGQVMTSFNGVSAYSNGADDCTGYSCSGYGTYGYEYQCVELAQRYFAEKYGTPNIWYANAIQMCDTHPSTVGKTTSPSPGDLAVFNIFPPYGHVGVITAVDYGNSVAVMEQNADVSGKNTYPWSEVACFLTYIG